MMSERSFIKGNIQTPIKYIETHEIGHGELPSVSEEGEKEIIKILSVHLQSHIDISCMNIHFLYILISGLIRE